MSKRKKVTDPMTLWRPTFEALQIWQELWRTSMTQLPFASREYKAICATGKKLQAIESAFWQMAGCPECGQRTIVWFS